MATYAVNYDELIAGVRDEANEYLEKKVAERQEARRREGLGVTKEGFAGDEIIAAGRKIPEQLDRHVFPRLFRR